MIYTILSIVLLFSCGMLVVENKLYIGPICKPAIEKLEEEKTKSESECPEGAAPYVYH